LLQHTLSHYKTIVDLARTSVFRVYIFKVTRVKHNYGLTCVHQKGGYTEPPVIPYPESLPAQAAYTEALLPGSLSLRVQRGRDTWPAWARIICCIRHGSLRRLCVLSWNAQIRANSRAKGKMALLLQVCCSCVDTDKMVLVTGASKVGRSRLTLMIRLAVGSKTPRAVAGLGA
jgi:hypothetical protein